MPSDQFLIIEKSNLKDLAKILASMLKSELEKVDKDPYMTPDKLAEEVPVLSQYLIKTQIRKGLYGKRVGAKGRLTAKVSEVKKYNRI